MNSTVESRLQELPVLNTRLHYMDNLRALAMLGGVFFHGALAYSPMLHSLWPAADAQQSPVVDLIVWFTHLFRMPLFFLIAGFFVAYLVQKRGMAGMLKNRALRILLPLIIFLPLCMWAVIAPLLSAVASVQAKSPVMEMIVTAMANPGTPPPPPTTMHLWFLYNLVFFCVFTWVLRYVNWQWLRAYFNRITPAFFLAIFPLLLVPALLSVAAPLPAPDSFLPQLWSFGFLGLFFALGCWIFSVENFIERFKSYGFKLLIMSVGLYVIFYWLIPKHFILGPSSLVFWKKLVISLCEAYISVWMSLACLVWGKTYLNIHNRFMRFISDSSYWIYIIHMPLIFALQYPMMDKDWSWLVKFSVTITVTLAVGVLSYLLLVRWTPIGWMLNGRR
jgi:glucan biosynthesis protein C